jgi:L-asparaginase II
MPHEHAHILTATAGATAGPMLIEVTRGDMVESRHRADVAIVDADGKVVRAWGDIEPTVYGRSAIKPLQALPLIESGAARIASASAWRRSRSPAPPITASRAMSSW